MTDDEAKRERIREASDPQSDYPIDEVLAAWKNRAVCWRSMARGVAIDAARLMRERDEARALLEEVRLYNFSAELQQRIDAALDDKKS